ncbi:ATP12 family chaperone protein [Sphingomonas desiccabilis]|uniref:ATPase n=1 Tax=Sphingomonas desiccabilis TaxID=429134 RepID=A0A4V1QPP2_9SPHN|nr:ATP12 family protein [Sphingomonas desiccabilis]MBB3909805.1 chaperone required for assembly of F1-ATPase [Sphingomonas desiccabilis]RXZ34487.1 ATPase [Sphingomonas desiccabilis]
MKRFWKTVAVEPAETGLGIALDGRPVRTPGRVPLALPTPALAQAVADEWNAVADRLDPRAMPLTGLANAAIDRVAPDPAAFAAGLAAYGESDLLCYRAEDPEPLVARQQAAWDPVLGWARQRYDVTFAVTAGVMHVAQPPATIARLAEATAARDAFALAGLSPIVTVTGSLVLALALAERAFDAETVWNAAHVDEDWQVERWGEDPLATEARLIRRRDFDAAVRFLDALR